MKNHDSTSAPQWIQKPLHLAWFFAGFALSFVVLWPFLGWFLAVINAFFLAEVLGLTLLWAWQTASERLSVSLD